MPASSRFREFVIRAETGRRYADSNDMRELGVTLLKILRERRSAADEASLPAQTIVLPSARKLRLFILATSPVYFIYYLPARYADTPSLYCFCLHQKKWRPR